MSYQDLEMLNNLREKGAITEEEYQREKEKILGGQPYFTGNEYWGMDLNTYCMLMHLAQFAGMVLPLAGLVLPIVMWQANKDKNAQIDEHGKNVVNWILSFILYVIGSAILCAILIGIPLLIAVGICDIVFIIMGAMKAKEGIAWKYPLSIRFFN